MAGRRWRERLKSFFFCVGDVEEVLDVEDADDVVGRVVIDGEPL